MSGLRLTIEEGRKLLDRCHGAVISKSVKECLEAVAPPPRKSRSDRYKSKWESLYALELADDLRAGRIEWWAYEPFSMVIVDSGGMRCRYTPDFISLSRGIITAAEIKGHLREAARLRFLAARERYPWIRFRMLTRDKSGWTEILVEAMANEAEGK